MRALSLFVLAGTAAGGFAQLRWKPSDQTPEEVAKKLAPGFIVFAGQVPAAAIDPVLLTTFCCIPSCILPAIHQSWDVMANSAMRVHHASTERGEAIVDARGKILAYLKTDEVVSHRVISKDRKTLVLKLDIVHGSRGGSRVTYYSRLLRIQTGTMANAAREFLRYQDDFLHKQRMSIHLLISVSDDGNSIVAGLKINRNGHSEDDVRTIDLNGPTFRDSASESTAVPKCSFDR